MNIGIICLQAVMIVPIAKPAEVFIYSRLVILIFTVRFLGKRATYKVVLEWV